MTRSVEARAPVLDLIASVADRGEFLRWPDQLVDVRPGSEYARQLHAARARTGLDESVVVGEARIDGRRVAVLAVEFAFLGGTIGVAAAHRLVAAVERATAERLPLLALPCSGGTRMQEGTVAFVQMVKIAAAVADHKRASLPYLVYLRHPTTGGVLASWASMGHLTIAEPGALIGFLGPRVYEALGAPLPEGVQRTENLLAHGLIDAAVPPDDLGTWLRRTFAILDRDSATADLPAADDEHAAELETDPWESVLLTRRSGRLGARELLAALSPDRVPLRGSGEGDAAAPAIIAAVARIAGMPCIVLGHNAFPDEAGGVPRALDTGALRTARRAIRLAAESALPLVTVIDTAGAELSVTAEQQGIAGQIARCLADLIVLDVPTVSILLGQGAGGAALAWLPADHVIAARHAWLSPLPPEGASAVVYRDLEHAAQLAREQGIVADALARNGIVDEVIGDGTAEQVCRRLGESLTRALRTLVASDPAERIARRRHRYRELGVPA